jgi:hypothetical protein
MTEKDPRPYIVVTVLLDQGARAAVLTQSHGDAMERALMAAHGLDVAGVDLIELPVPAVTFAALRKQLGGQKDAVGFYEVFPLASHLSPEVRITAGQFLAAEALWKLEEAGQLGGVPLNVKLDLPKGWEREPQKIHERLVAEGALDLTETAIQTYLSVKQAWDAVR